MIYWQRPQGGKVYFYKLDVDRDLFGRYTVSRCWGVSDSRQGGLDRHAFETLAEVRAFVRETRIRRKKRGYHCTRINNTFFNNLLIGSTTVGSI